MQKFIHILIFCCINLIINAQETDIDPNGYNKFYYPNGNIFTIKKC